METGIAKPIIVPVSYVNMNAYERIHATRRIMVIIIII